MLKETKTLFICEYCGTQHEDEEWMRMHEEICPLNPKNQPCSMCENLILNIGCSKGINIECIDNIKVKCFCYKEGIPQLPFINSIKPILDGGNE